MDVFAAVRLAGGAAVLAVAAASDVRTRHVRDRWWIILGTAGLLLLAAELAATYAAVNHWLLLGSAAILFYAVFYGKPILEEDGLHLRPVRILVLAAAAVGFLGGVVLPFQPESLPVGTQVLPIAELASAPVLVVLYQVFYQLGLLHGGADAKALIAVALLVPTYPEASPFPWVSLDPRTAGTLQTLFPFSFVVLVNAAILFLAVPLAYLVLNAARGDVKLPQALLGTRARLDALPDHTWLMEKIDRRGEHVLVLFPRRDVDREGEAAKLREVGVTKVWVTHQVPFVVPLFAGYLLAFLAGNLLLGFLSAVLPRP